MPSPELDNLVQAGLLNKEAPSAVEINGLTTSGEARVHDALNEKLALESRFDLAYNGAHALALAALRRLGFRSDNRYAVFQALPYSLGVQAEVWRMLAKCHTLRNQFEYEGMSEVNERLVDDLVSAATSVRDALRAAVKGK